MEDREEPLLREDPAALDAAVELEPAVPAGQGPAPSGPGPAPATGRAAVSQPVTPRAATLSATGQVAGGRTSMPILIPRQRRPSTESAQAVI